MQQRFLLGLDQDRCQGEWSAACRSFSPGARRCVEMAIDTRDGTKAL